MDANIKQIRVLMIGPGEGIISGISSLIETFLPALEQQVTLLYLDSVKGRNPKDSGKFSFRNLLIALSQYTRFLIALLRFRPQILHVHTSQGLAWLKDTYFVLVGKIFRIRIVLHMHGGDFDTIYSRSSRLLQRYTSMVLGWADAIISVSEEWKERLDLLFPGKRIVTIRNCIDLSSYHCEENCRDGANVNILFIGRIGPLKGVFDLVEAIGALKPGAPDIHVWLVGPEERNGDFQYARGLIEQHHLTTTCEMTGPLTHEKVRQLFTEANIFVLPSYYECLPMALLEALAANLPVVATAVGGIPEFVQNGHNGFLIPSGDVQALSSALERLIADKDLRQIMSKRSRVIAERELDAGPYVQKLVSLYSSAASHP